MGSVRRFGSRRKRTFWKTFKPLRQALEMPDSVLLNGIINESNFILTNQWIKSLRDGFAELFRMFGFGFEWVIRFDSDGI